MTFAPSLKWYLLPLLIASAVHPLPAAPFPESGLLPKEETGTRNLLKAHPDYDGRGIVVAVFDSGIDPGATGLRQTSHGQPKLIDTIDATGSGDVDTSTIVEVKGRQVTGLSGRSLTLPEDWKRRLHPEKPEVHLGMKAGWEWFPSTLVARLKKERREVFARKHALLRAEVAGDDALEPQEREARLQALDAAIENYEDPGPIFDCVVYRDQATGLWRAWIDTDEDGELSDETALTDYHREHQFISMGELAQLNVAVNLYNDGRLLSLVVPSNMHGTHVAGIIGAHHPDQPELDGLAPGVQLISVKIGDTRLDGMETGSAVIRGLRAVASRSCDLINMSYGEPTRLPNEGRIVEEISRLVHEEDVIFVASAGNAGPALSTVGAPGATTSSVIGVGAYVTPAMMQAGYSLRKTQPDLPYTWSSRGPASDGAWGVSICAPGGALAPVPNFTLRRNRYANGTSMSSPNACGSLAVLLGALKTERLPYSAASVKRIIENTAVPLKKSTVFAHGHGLLRVDRALESFRQHPIAKAPHFDISLPSRQGARGLYLRATHDLPNDPVFPVAVTPRFAPGHPNQEKIAFNLRLRLESTVPWLKVPEFLTLTNRASQFTMELATQALPRGQALHTGEVQAIDLSHPEAGPVFRVPATILLPSAPSPVSAKKAWSRVGSLKAGQIDRAFLVPPPHASWAKVRLTARGMQPHSVVLHLQQILSQTRHPESGARHRFTATPDLPWETRHPVVPGQLLEITTASNWSSQTSLPYELSIEFGGASASPETLTFSSGSPLARVDLHTSLSEQKLRPKAQWSHWEKEIPPNSSTLRPLDDPRDTAPERLPLWEAHGVYAFTLSQAASVTPRFPHINRRLYEADIQSQLFSLTDTHGQILAQDDGWDPAAIRLGKGDYTVTYHWRHTNVSVLTFLSDLPLTLQGTLSSPQGIRLHDTRRGALNGTGSIGVLTLLSGERLPLHLSTPSPADLPQLPLAAQRLTGVLTLHPEAPQAAARLVYDLPQARATSSPPDHADVQAWRRAQLERRLDTNDTTTFDEDLKRYRHDYPEDIEGDVLALRRADTVEKRRHHHDELVALCDQIVEKLDPLAIALYRGRRASATAPDEAKRWERHFHILTDALYRKCRAIAYHDGQREKAGEAYDDKPFDEAFTALQEWVDTESAPYVLAHIRHHRRQGHWGAALNLLQRHMKEAPPTPLLHKKRVTILESLGWELWSDHESQWNLRRFPSADLTPETANVAKTPSP